MRHIVTVPRIRAIVSDARTDRDIVDALRRHRIRYTYSTSTGFLHIMIPSRSGPVLVYLTACRSAPPAVIRSAPFRTVQVNYFND